MWNIRAAAVACLIVSGAAAAENQISPSNQGRGNVDVRFEGGSLAEFYDFIESADTSVQVVFRPEVGELRMPAFELEGLSPPVLFGMPERLIAGVDIKTGQGYRGPSDDPPPMTYFVSAGAETLAGETTFDLDFPGGTMNDFVEALREKADANILLKSEAADVEVPPLRLRDAEVHNVLVTLLPDLEVTPEGDRRLDFDWIQNDKETRLLYVIGVEKTITPKTMPPSVRHWSLGSIVEASSLTAEDVLGAIEVAGEFFASEVIVRYHEPTRVLIARGGPQDLKVIDELLNRVGDSSRFMVQDQ